MNLVLQDINYDKIKLDRKIVAVTQSLSYSKLVSPSLLLWGRLQWHVSVQIVYFCL
jgi:hypothetical protein